MTSVGAGGFEPVKYPELLKYGQDALGPLVRDAARLCLNAHSNNWSAAQCNIEKKAFVAKMAKGQELWLALEVLGFNLQDRRDTFLQDLPINDLDVLILLAELLPAATRYGIKLPEGGLASLEEVARFGHRLLGRLNPATEVKELQHLRALLNRVRYHDSIGALYALKQMATNLGLAKANPEIQKAISAIPRYAEIQDPKLEKDLMPLIRGLARVIRYTEDHAHHRKLEVLEELFKDEGLAPVAKLINHEVRAFLQDEKTIQASSKALKRQQVVASLQAREELRDALPQIPEGPEVQDHETRMIRKVNQRLSDLFQRAKLSDARAEIEALPPEEGKRPLRLNFSTGIAGSHKAFWTSVSLDSLETRCKLRFDKRAFLAKIANSKSTASEKLLADKMLDSAVKAVRTEVQIWTALHSRKIPNIPKLLSHTEDDQGITIEAENYRGGDLFNWIVNGQDNLALCHACFGCLVQFLAAIHGQKDGAIVHRDLKPDNLLVQTENGRIKAIGVTDFDFMRQIREGQDSIPDVGGTTDYMAPETLNGKGTTPASDIWSAAVTLFVIRYGRPFAMDAKDQRIQFSNVTSIKVRYLALTKKNSYDAHDEMLLKMLNPEPSPRPSASNIFAWWKKLKSS